MSFRRIITKLGTIPYNAILLALIFVAPYIYRGNRLHDAHVLSLGQMPLSMKFGIMAGISVFIGYVIGVVIKGLYYKPRPIPQPYSNRWQKIDASSFPSMHTAITLILAYYGIRSAYIFTSGRVEISVIILRIVLFVTISISRIVLKKHYRTDVLVGVLLGLCVVYIPKSFLILMW